MNSPGTTAYCDRSDFAFSPGGRFATCIRDDFAGRTFESWALSGDNPVPRTVHGLRLDAEISAAPLDDGRILLLRRDPETVPPRHQLHLLTPAGHGWDLKRVGEVPAPLGGSVLVARSLGLLGVVLTLEDVARSTVWAVTGEPPELVRVLSVPRLLIGGVWLSPHVLALTATAGRDRGSAVAVDLAAASWQRIFYVSSTSADRILLADPGSGRFVVTTDATGEERIGWGRLGQRDVRFPDSLHRPGLLRRPLALDDQAERLLVHEQAGAVSRLFVHSLDTGHLQVVPGPPGTVGGPASWSSGLARFRFSTPSTPPTLATLRFGPEPEWRLPERHAPAHAGATLIEFPGAAGPIEAITYDGPEWIRRRHLVLALHGGPLSAWKFEYTPLLQHLARAGAAVVAPNYRGSTGYGTEHLRAVLGNWGGPDLADVLCIARAIDRMRDPALPRPVLLGASYGGFLALLAACDQPDLWSGCVALAPFLSGPQLHAGACPVVRRRVEQLGGLSSDRDVLRSCAALSVPLLLVHGAMDPTVPVEQSRALRRRLRELGRHDGDNFEYWEADGDHNDVVDARLPGLAEKVLGFCLGSPSTREACVAGSGGR